MSCNPNFVTVGERTLSFFCGEFLLVILLSAEWPKTNCIGKRIKREKRKKERKRKKEKTKKGIKKERKREEKEKKGGKQTEIKTKQNKKTRGSIL